MTTTTDRNGTTITIGQRVLVTIARYGECSGNVRRVGIVREIKPWGGSNKGACLSVTLARPVNGFGQHIEYVNPDCVNALA